jgi:hypothetical protein
MNKKKLNKLIRKTVAKAMADALAGANAPKKKSSINPTVLARSRIKKAQRESHAAANQARFMPAKPMPGVVPADSKAAMAMDEVFLESAAWAGQALIEGQLYDGTAFLGYAFLSLLSQRPEYRVVSETIAMEATREWIELQSSGDAVAKAAGEGGDPDVDEDPDEKKAEAQAKADKIKKIEAEFDRLKVQDAFRKFSEQDGYFGRAHLYLDTGDTDERDELVQSIGGGNDEISKSKVNPEKPLLAVRNVEPVWVYPANYDSIDPLKPAWFNPATWFVQGKEVHCSRLLTGVAREVPDLLKPQYAFGGLSTSQMVKPYVDAWLKTKNSVNELISAFAQMILETDLSETLSGGGDQLDLRADLFNNYRDNRNLMMVNKGTEELKNVITPLGTLDALQAQSQEHMASVSRIPLVKLLGIQPAGLNASSEGELITFEDMIRAYQKKMYGEPLNRVLWFVQLSLFGEVDPTITVEFNPLRQMTKKEGGEIDKSEAEADQIRIDSGVLDPVEARRALASKEDSRYHDIDVEDVPDLGEEEADGLMPKKPPGQGGGGAEGESGGEGGEGGGQDRAIVPFGGAADEAAFDDGSFEASKHPRVPSGPEGGEFTASGGGGAAGAGEPAGKPNSFREDTDLNPKAIKVGGDKWNKDTAVRLEREYVRVRPKIEALVAEALGKKVEAGEEDEPAGWDGLTGSAQTEIEEKFKKEVYDDYYKSEEENWHENGDALNDAKSLIAHGFNSAGVSEWATDALDQYIEGEPVSEYEAGEGKEDTPSREEQGLPRIPYTIKQLMDAISIETDDGKTEIEFDDEKLMKPDNLVEGQSTLPGIEEPTPSDALTKEMREGLTKTILDAFNEKAEATEGDMDPPEYLQESAQEQVEESWNEKDDEEKYHWGAENGLVNDDESKAGWDTIVGLPKKFEPMNESSGDNYVKTQRVARYLSQERAAQLLVERYNAPRKPSGEPMNEELMLDKAREAVASVDTALWRGWKQSSTSNEGKLLQVAVADELGGKLRTGVITKHGADLDRDQIAKWADRVYNTIGGYAGVKAYIRAKWEVTQYLLDKADIHTVDVYRAVNISKEAEEPISITELTDMASASHEGAKYKVPDFDKGEPGAFIYFKDHDAAKSFVMKKLEGGPKREQVEGGYTKLPDIKVERNGAASTTTDPKVANDWDGSSGRVVLRASVPRTAVVSVPAYGQNVHSEKEVVIAGTAWVGWDAWSGRAPTFDAVPMAGATT